MKAQIRLRICAVRSGPSLSAYVRRQVSAWRDPYLDNDALQMPVVPSGEDFFTRLLYCLGEERGTWLVSKCTGWSASMIFADGI